MRKQYLCNLQLTEASQIALQMLLQLKWLRDGGEKEVKNMNVDKTKWKYEM